jgi:PPM family protein phosphatase
MIVADGIGRYKGAAFASKITVEKSVEFLNEHWAQSQDPKKTLAKLSKYVSLALFDFVKEQVQFQSMATTLTILAFKETQLWSLHIGDTRAYQWQANQINQLTDDHSLAWEQYKHGAFPKSTLRHHPNQRLLTRCMSAKKRAAIVDISSHEWTENDLFLLCSDGLSKVLDDEEIAGLFEHLDDLDSLARTLIDMSAASDDDVTVVVARPS